MIGSTAAATAGRFGRSGVEFEGGWVPGDLGKWSGCSSGTPCEEDSFDCFSYLRVSSETGGL